MRAGQRLGYAAIAGRRAVTRWRGRKRDRALHTARELLTDWICECGDEKCDHANASGASECLIRNCRCKAFAPAAFLVQRAPARHSSK